MANAIEDPHFFFRQKQTLDALEYLASVSELIIYRGAGVSLDRTGVTWTKLVKDVFRLSTILDKETPQTEAIKSLLDTATPPEQLASIVVQAFRKTRESENDFLGSKLKDILYRENGWNPGLALRNILRAASLERGYTTRTLHDLRVLTRSSVVMKTPQLSE